MRGALALLDWADASIADLRRLLLRAAFAPAFLRAADGRRFLAHLFTLDARAHDAMTCLLMIYTNSQVCACSVITPALREGMSR